jgi:Tfp pilus assembly protein PilN
MRAVNLLPREEPKRSRLRFTIGVQLAVLSPFVLGSLLAAGYLMASSKVSDNKATLQALQEELAKLPPPLPTPSAGNSLAVQRDQRVTALSSALQARISWDRILHEISSVLPEDVWLTTLSATSPQAPAPAAAPMTTTTATTTTVPSDTVGNESTDTTTTTPVPVPVAPVTAPLNLDGYTYSQEGVARFLTRLAVIPELQDVKLISSAVADIEGRTVVRFSITAGIRKQTPS